MLASPEVKIKWFTPDEFNNLSEEEYSKMYFVHNDGQGDTSIIPFADQYRWIEDDSTHPDYPKMKERVLKMSPYDLYVNIFESLGTNGNMTMLFTYNDGLSLIFIRE